MPEIAGTLRKAEGDGVWKLYYYVVGGRNLHFYEISLRSPSFYFSSPLFFSISF